MSREKFNKADKIVLMVLPFLTPLCPPMGISSLKAYLKPRGYNIKTFDVMTVMEIRQHCYEYFDTLESFIEEKKRAFYFNVALDVLTNNFMIHLSNPDESLYVDLVKKFVNNNFYTVISDEQALELKKKVGNFYDSLKEYVINLIKGEKPKLLGLSTYKGTLPASIFVSKLIKENFPEVEVFMGGPIFSQELHPSSPNFNRFLNSVPYIDRIFIGEGEILLYKFLENELEDKRVYELSDINNELIVVEDLPLPDFSDFSLANYPMLPTFTSRGCVCRCSFCAETVFWRKYRCKTVDKILKEFQHLYEQHKRRIFLLTDCLINPVIDELCDKMLENNLNFYWDVYFRVDKRAADIERVNKWRRGGFYRARLGVESGSPRMLGMMDKKINIEQIKTTLINLATAGIKTTTYWIAGHPGETEEDFQQTLDLLEELQDYIYEAECDPFRYFYFGQVNDDEWNEGGNKTLYPEDAEDVLLTQTWTLNTTPSRPVAYDRLCRFKEKCKKLGIPNPYSVVEINEADNRWHRLHKNAVPYFMDLNKGLIDDIGMKNRTKEIAATIDVDLDDIDDFNF